MTLAGRKTTFPSVLAKDPKRRKSRAGSHVGPIHNDKFVLYVEGPRDREILECWARRFNPGLARCIERSTFILGGRQPARAVADFRKRGGIAAGYSGLIVLDRDDHPDDNPAERETEDAGEASAVAASDSEPEVFVWGLRHIESYLLVPAAIRRLLRMAAEDRTVERFIETAGAANAPSDTGGRVHAKRTLGSGGTLSLALGTDLRAGDIARAMRIEDLHVDIRTLFDRIHVLAGLTVKGPEVVIRGR
jgi:hypothetical protein